MTTAHTHSARSRASRPAPAARSSTATRVVASGATALATRKIAQISGRLRSAITRGGKAAGAGTAKVTGMVRRHPYRTLGIAAGVAALVGLVIARKRRA
ncbi:MAG: hypothetical protein JWQ62_509 [Lacunisphaera sp.]|nr:hypothetical protein [Lacunisphaera sp.]